MNIHYSIHYRVSLNTRFTSKGEASEVHILLLFCLSMWERRFCKQLCVSNELQNEILKVLIFCQFVHSRELLSLPFLQTVKLAS